MLFADQIGHPFPPAHARAERRALSARYCDYEFGGGDAIGWVGDFSTVSVFVCWRRMVTNRLNFGD